MAKTYAYRVRDNKGKLITGFLEAEDEAGAAAQLRERNYFIIDIRRAPQHKRKPVLFRKVGARDLAVYCKQFATMVNAGVPILNCLTVLENQTENKKLAGICGSLAECLQEGRTLSEAVQRFPDIFPAIFVSMIRVGEESGSLDRSLDRLSLYFEKEYEIKEKLKSAMIYPAFVLAISFLVIFVLLTFVLPAIIAMLVQQNVVLPLPTRIVMAVSGFLFTYWPGVICGTLALCIACGWFIRTERGRHVADNVLIKIPVFGDLIKKTIISRFTRTFSILLRSGIPVIQSLDIVKEAISNSIIAVVVEKAEISIKEGSGIADLLAKDSVLPPMVTQMIKIGEDTGALEELLEKVAIFYEQEVNTNLSRLVKLVEPVLILFVGGIAGIIISSVLLPVIEITGIF